MDQNNNSSNSNNNKVYLIQELQESVPNLVWVLNIWILEKLPEFLNHLIESILPQDLIYILIVREFNI